LNDTVLRLIEMRIGEIWGWAHTLSRPGAPMQIPEEVMTELAYEMDNAAISDNESRPRARILLGPWKQASDKRPVTRAAKVRERLAANARHVRPLLKRLVVLGLEGAEGNSVIKALRELRDCYRVGQVPARGATEPLEHIGPRSPTRYPERLMRSAA